MIIKIPERQIVICVMYLLTGYAAERSPIVNQLVHILLNDLKISDNVIVNYVGITEIDSTDIANLLSQYLFGTRIFVSALNSNDCARLSTLFFNSYPTTVHCNAYSTATNIPMSYQLVRVLPSDNYTSKLYVKLAGTNGTIIVYDSSSDSSVSLLNNITSYMYVQLTIDTYNNPGWESNLYSYVGSSATIMALIGSNMLNVLDTIQGESLLYTYRFIFSDASNEYSFPTLASYLQEHNTVLIQAFINNSDIAYADYVNVVLNQPTHPASDQVIKFRQLFDLALLYVPMKQSYVTLDLDTNYSNKSGTYGIMNYDNNGNLQEYGFGWVYDTDVFSTVT